MRTTTRRRVTCLALAGVLLPLLAAGGCNNAAQGALSGGTLGALGGLAIGSVTGDAGAGAVIGAVAGSIGGAVIGDQNRRAAERQDEIRSPNE